MQIDDFADILRRHGISHGAGVPCSFFTPLVNHMMVDPELDYTSATSEGEAVAIAAGLTTAGKPAFALMQNSGLGNAVNPITSMLYIYSIPVTLLVSHRGEPGKPDEPQHALMGQITEALSELCGLRTHVLDPARFADQLGAALGDGVPAAFICRKGTLKGGPEAPDLDLRFTTRATAPANTGTFPRRVATRASPRRRARSAQPRPRGGRPIRRRNTRSDLHHWQAFRASSTSSTTPTSARRTASTWSVPWAVQPASASASPTPSPRAPQSCSTATEPC